MKGFANTGLKKQSAIQKNTEQTGQLKSKVENGRLRHKYITTLKVK